MDDDAPIPRLTQEMLDARRAAGASAKKKGGGSRSRITRCSPSSVSLASDRAGHSQGSASAVTAPSEERTAQPKRRARGGGGGAGGAGGAEGVSDVSDPLAFLSAAAADSKPKTRRPKKKTWKDFPADSGELTEKQHTQFVKAAKEYTAAAYALNAIFGVQRPFPTEFQRGLSMSDVARHKAKITDYCREAGITRRTAENLSDALRELVKLTPKPE